MRDLEPVDGAGAGFGGENPFAGDDHDAFVDRDFELGWIDARQGGKNEDLTVGLEHIDRRLPARPARVLFTKAEELTVKALGPLQDLARLHPHQRLEVSWHPINGYIDHWALATGAVIATLVVALWKSASIETYSPATLLSRL